MPRLAATFLILTVSSLGALADNFRAVAETDRQWRPEGAQLTLELALHIAEAEALKNHVRFSNDLPPQFRYEHDKTLGYVWVFVYEGKVPMPGNHFAVFVNDRTRHAVFMPGE